MPIRAKVVMTAKVKGTNDLIVLSVLTSLCRVIGSNFIATPTIVMKRGYCGLANTKTRII